MERSRNRAGGRARLRVPWRTEWVRNAVRINFPLARAIKSNSEWAAARCADGDVVRRTRELLALRRRDASRCVVTTAAAAAAWRACVEQCKFGSVRNGVFFGWRLCAGALKINLNICYICYICIICKICCIEIKTIYVRKSTDIYNWDSTNQRY